jgi:hypothetical protein
LTFIRGICERLRISHHPSLKHYKNREQQPYLMSYTMAGPAVNVLTRSARRNVSSDASFTAGNHFPNMTTVFAEGL